MLLAACYQLGGTSASPLCGTVSWNRHWQMTQPLTVKPVWADSSTCTQAGPRSALELNQLDVQNMLAFIFPRLYSGQAEQHCQVEPRTYLRKINLWQVLRFYILLASSHCLALFFGSRVAPWPAGLKELGFPWTGWHLWLDSQVSLRWSKPLSQLSTPSLPLSHGFSMLKKGWPHTPAFLSGGSPFFGQLPSFTELQELASSGLLPLCRIWSELAKGLGSDGAEVWREGVDAQAITKCNNIGLISFENKGNTAWVEFLHTTHSRHISAVFRLDWVWL